MQFLPAFSHILSHALLAAAIVLASAVAMEAVATFTHRYVMHGIGWRWHCSHHSRAKQHWFESNDLYAVAAAALAITLMVLGNGAWWPLYWVGVGMTLYGAAYLLLHDGLTHRRFKWPGQPARVRHAYLKRLVQAHRLHHAVHTRTGAVSFGFLYAAPPAQLAAVLAARLRPLAVDLQAQARTQRLRVQSHGGMALAALLLASWGGVLAMALWGIAWTGLVWLAAPLVVALLCWLKVGLFIVAHDAMHASLAPAYPRLNQWLGRTCLALYAGFSFQRFARKHVLHHLLPTSAADPDFHAACPHFWPWYGAFMRRYFGWPEAAGFAAVAGALMLIAPPLHVLLFWMLPALLASLQLFTFGTWLPHRPGRPGFADQHCARSSRYGYLHSLLTCYHFGYHHEHHLHPGLPWWRLPAQYKRSMPPDGAVSTTPAGQADAAPAPSSRPTSARRA